MPRNYSSSRDYSSYDNFRPDERDFSDYGHGYDQSRDNYYDRNENNFNTRNQSYGQGRDQGYENNQRASRYGRNQYYQASRYDQGRDYEYDRDFGENQRRDRHGRRFDYYPGRDGHRGGYSEYSGNPSGRSNRYGTQEDFGRDYYQPGRNSNRGNSNHREFNDRHSDRVDWAKTPTARQSAYDYEDEMDY